MAVTLSPPTPLVSHVPREDYRRRHLLRLLNGCPSAPLLRRIHALALRVGLLSDPDSSSGFLTAACRSAHLGYTLKVFDQILQPNLYSWNVLLRACASSQGDGPALALRLLSRLLREGRHSPDRFTYPPALKAASALRDGRLGRALHGLVAKSPRPLRTDVFVANSLVHMYASCGELDSACGLFARMPRRDVVSWNSLIHSLVDAGRCAEAVEAFWTMEDEEDQVTPNRVTMVGLLTACGKMGDLDQGKSFHRYLESRGIEQDLILRNALLDMYVKCRSLQDALDVFDEMPERDVFSWTTMVAGYARSGDYRAARRVLNQVPAQGIAPWNALISSYEQSGLPRDALHAFRECLAHVQPDEVTLVSALSACAELGSLDMGSWIHAYAKEHGIKLDTHLTTSLIDMYAKCGALPEALEVFESAGRRDIYTWSAAIAALAMHGRGPQALDLFERMLGDDVAPNEVTFMNVLCACSHAGLVDEGRRYFNRVRRAFGIEPRVEHYASMVDILGRAGHLEEAKELIDGMPVPPGAPVWGALLGACSIHRNVELGELAFGRLVELQPENDGAYVLMSNLYARSGRWDGVAMLRKRMREAGLKKERGCSFVEVGGVLHEFLVGDTAHPLSEAIYSKLDEMMSKLREAGYAPEGAEALQYIEGEEMREHALTLHSEKLAIAFALVTVDSPAPIRIAKNLRICQDCHTVAKLVSRVYRREILIRDRYRFHHFRDGQCSCMDYW